VVTKDPHAFLYPNLPKHDLLKLAQSQSHLHPSIEDAFPISPKSSINIVLPTPRRGDIPNMEGEATHEERVGCRFLNLIANRAIATIWPTSPSQSVRRPTYIFKKTTPHLVGA
jgi:hypothetical protein